MSVADNVTAAMGSLAGIIEQIKSENAALRARVEKAEASPSHDLAMILALRHEKGEILEKLEHAEDEIIKLRAEVERLRDEVEELKKGDYCSESDNLDLLETLRARVEKAEADTALLDRFEQLCRCDATDGRQISEDECEMILWGHYWGTPVVQSTSVRDGIRAAIDAATEV